MNNVLRSSCSVWIISLLFASGCRSAPPVNPAGDTLNSMQLSGSADQKVGPSITPSAVSEGGGTLLAVPTKDQLKKNSIDSAALNALEIGSPDSIRLAVERISADSRGMTDTNRIALSVAGELMTILYPLESINWSIPSVPETGSYIGAIRSARMGVYDYNTGNADFLSLILPSLVMVISTAQGDYYADAEAALLKSASLNGKSVLPFYFLGLLTERQGRAEEAGSYYKKAWDTDSSCYPAGEGYVRYLVAKENGTAALDVARRLLSRYPENIRMVQLCAEAAFVMKDWTSADPYVLKALKLDSNNTRFLLMRARILIERKEYLKANSLLDAFATTNRSDKSYLLLRSRVIREWNKNLVLAITILQEAQRLYPDDIEVLLASAEVCYQSGATINQLEGRAFVLSVLGKDPLNKTATALLVNDYLDANDWTSAVKLAEQLVSLNPGDDTRVLLLRSYLGSGRTDKAVPLAKGLYNVPSPSDEITALYLRSLVESGDAKTAAALIAARMGEAHSALKSELFYYESRMGTNPDAILSSLRSSLLSDPRNSQSLFAMYQWYLDKDDYRKAEYYLKQVIALNPLNQKYAQLLSGLQVQLSR